MEDNTVGKIFLIIFITIFAFAFIGPILPFILPIVSSIGPIFWIVLILLVILIMIISTYNKLVRLSKKVSQSAGTIDVYLKQRFDLIPNLVETVKGYAKYEEEVLEKIVKLRQEYADNSNDNMNVNATLNDKYNKLIAIVESYPELKANESFLNLQKQLSKTESQLQAARRIYNSEVTEYNTKVLTFPSNVIAGIFGFKEIALFEIKTEERENVDIKI